MTDNPLKMPNQPRPKNKPEPIRPRGRPRRETIDVPASQVDMDNLPPAEGELRTLKATDLVEFNHRAEYEFVKIVSNLLAASDTGVMRAREVCIESAARIDISIETAKRYLLKHSASISEFNIEKGWVKARKRK
jgi:hypothetical protein